MKGSTIVAGAVAGILALAALGIGYRALQRDARPMPTESRSQAEPNTGPTDAAHTSFIYGRVATVDGAAYTGRLRWGGNEEAFWGNYFNGAKTANPWIAHVPPSHANERSPISIFGLEVGSRERTIDSTRLLMSRFGDIARVEAGLRNVQVTLKSGAVFDLKRSEAGDFDDGVRVWDEQRGVIDLDTLQIRSIDFLSAPGTGAVPDRIFATVRTAKASFTGFVQWDREQCIGSDEFDGRGAEGDVRLPFAVIRSIARRSRDSFTAALHDGREIVLSGPQALGSGNRGVYVDDPRYGRVLVSLDALEGVEFSRGGAGPSYDDFPRGGPLTGAVTARDGRRIAGRLVYDLDESEITETLDAPFEGVDYTVPFGMIASIVLPAPESRGDGHARVTLQSGETLQLRCSGDLGERNGGMLIFASGSQRAEYVPWTEVREIEFDRPSAMYPPLAVR